MHLLWGKVLKFLKQSNQVMKSGITSKEQICVYKYTTYVIVQCNNFPVVTIITIEQMVLMPLPNQ